ncbi:MAG: hypothetical protein KAY65_15385 [Planctomycetes bacterium]|nr:hypothetical protein [Planctomycetota bacterium]
MNNRRLLCSVIVLFCACTCLGASAEHAISLIADGRSEIVISGGRLAVNHLSWGKPTNLTVDGSPIDLSWEGNISQPVPCPIAGEYWIRKLRGRDGGYAVQIPGGFLLACIDNPNGTDNYAFELRSEPLEPSTDWMRVDASGRHPFVHFDFTGLAGFADDVPAGSQIEFSVVVDGSEEFIFSNGSFVIRHLAWGAPTDLFYLDGEQVLLSWTDGQSQRVPVVLPGRFEVIQTGGRRPIYPVETAGGFVLSVADEDIGADLYSWKIVAVPEVLLIKAVVEMDPDYLDLASAPQWLTCRLWLPAGYHVVDIDPYSILLNETVEAPWAWFDEERQIAMVKFKYAELQSLLRPGGYDVTVGGILADRTRFTGTGRIVIGE